MQKLLLFKLIKKWSLAECFCCKVMAFKDHCYGLMAFSSAMWSQVRVILKYLFCAILWLYCHSVGKLLLTAVCRMVLLIWLLNLCSFLSYSVPVFCFTHKGRCEITELRSGQGTVSSVDCNFDLAFGKIVVRISY